MSWNDGYITEINYTSAYSRELSPTQQRLCLLNQRLANALPAGGRYLELGFGQGLSLNLHAAAHEAEFWGNDFNPAHAGLAQQMQAACGSNLQLSDDSFEQLASQAERGLLPSFDAIALHGVWSWVSPLNRAALVRILRHCLKPGGVVYLSYNANPGWAAATPLRQLLTLHSQRAGQGPILQKIEMALNFAQQMAKQGNGYFRHHPEMVERLEQLQGQNRHYLAHEFFNADWQPMSFAEVGQWLDEAKLQFAGSAHLLDQLDYLQLSSEAQQLLNTLADPILRESVRDYFCYTQFRRDLFVRGALPLSPAEQLVKINQQWLTMLCPAEHISLKIKAGRGEHSLRPELYQPVIEAMVRGDGYLRFDQLMAQLTTQNLSAMQVWQALLVLIGMGHVGAAQSPEQQARVTSRCQQLNRFLVNKTLHGVNHSHLVSPATGGGIALNPLEQAFLHAQSQGMQTVAEIARHCADTLAGLQQKFQIEGEANPSQERQLAYLQQHAQDFLTNKHSLLQRLGLSL